jgi:peptidoglycan/LPS O-acetylase OafA/YrhL
LSRYYRPELDALRFFAFLGVFGFHLLDYVPVDPTRSPRFLDFATIGAFGVPVFFLLSAFLITELLLKELGETSRVHVKAFYVRRVLRIWPLYFVAFYGLTLLGHFLPDVGPTTRGSILAFTFFAGNWYVTRFGWIAGPVDPLWSISVEEQFYLTIPLLIAYGKRRALAACSVLFLVVSYVVIWRYAQHPTAGDNGQWTNSFVQFQFFAAGTLLAVALRGRLPRLHPAARIAIFAFGIGCWMLALVRFGVKSWDAHPTQIGAMIGWLLILLGCVLLFVGVLGTEAKFIPRWLAYLGRISFGLYVFHSLAFHFTFVSGGAALTRASRALHLSDAGRNALGLIIVFASTVLVAHLSFQYFERPFLRLKDRFTFVPAREDQAESQRSSQ